MNPGFKSSEIEKLKKECEAEGLPFVYVEDEHELDKTGEYAQIQFVGRHEDKDVIYDAAVYTLELHYQSELLEEAEKRVSKMHPQFKPIGDRDEEYTQNEEWDELIEDFMEEIEEEDSLKVQEFVAADESFDFGIGLEVALNVPEIDDKVLSKFVMDFNKDQLKLDRNLYSFKSSE
ncbi:hypothetical protein LAG90_01260 [Marinilongibacter aquaticus]|uniref:hypothetical protein n=1 Tax=Marinilongibacter aquaticus TaxID=2975157 RepID=UPI0021BDEB35|nr:hypothetical protein [Marinilongibacter aquaticus]UBM59285.1 hypothetical protein LAG90_01260 [Marinilongibacter aquaticus]